MKKGLVSFFGIFSLFSFGKLLHHPTIEGESQKPEKIHEKDEIKTTSIVSDELAFAGQPVPMATPAVKRRFYTELATSKYWRFIATNLTVKSDRYFPVVRPILKKYGIPDDFKYIPLMESGFTNKVSVSGAAGPWQLMPETAKHYGLLMNNQIDERYNLALSTDAACKYIAHLHHQLGDWTLAAAAFNKGLDGIKNAVARQKTASYYTLKLNPQAQHYVFRILATKEVVEHPSRHGFINKAAHFHYSIPTLRIKVNNSITNLSAFAKKHGISLQTLRAYNPWLRANRFDNPGRKVCYLEIPLLNEFYVPKVNAI